MTPAGLPPLEDLLKLPQDEAAWRRVLLAVLPANARALELIERHLAAIEVLLRAGAAPENVLSLGALPEAAPVVTTEALAKAVLASPSVAVGTESDFEVQFTDLAGRGIRFQHLSITQVDIAAPQLLNADDVRLRLFHRSSRRVPEDLAAEFTGTSAVSGTWQASFSNRRIEYDDLTGQSKLYLALRNSAGNSGASTFELRFYARVFAPSPSTTGPGR